jgi:hypothetical protein
MYKQFRKTLILPELLYVKEIKQNGHTQKLYRLDWDTWEQKVQDYAKKQAFKHSGGEYRYIEFPTIPAGFVPMFDDTLFALSKDELDEIRETCRKVVEALNSKTVNPHFSIAYLQLPVTIMLHAFAIVVHNKHNSEGGWITQGSSYDYLAELMTYRVFVHQGFSDPHTVYCFSNFPLRYEYATRFGDYDWKTNHDLRSLLPVLNGLKYHMAAAVQRRYAEHNWISFRRAQEGEGYHLNGDDEDVYKMRAVKNQELYEDLIMKAHMIKPVEAHDHYIHSTCGSLYGTEEEIADKQFIIDSAFAEVPQYYKLTEQRDA